jgi:hypothetical protein
MSSEVRYIKSILDITSEGYEVVDDGLSVSYYFDGNLHREEDLPAYIDFNGTQMWYIHGELHRETGPAKIYDDSTLRCEDEKVYYLRGSEITGKDLTDFKKFISSSLEEMPLFINHPLLKEYAAHRLKEISHAGKVSS